MGAAGRGVERVAYRESFQLIESRRSSFMPSRYPAIDPNSLVKKKEKKRAWVDCDDETTCRPPTSAVQHRRFSIPIIDFFFFCSVHTLVDCCAECEKGDETLPQHHQGLKIDEKQNSRKLGIVLESKDGTESISLCAAAASCCCCICARTVSVSHPIEDQLNGQVKEDVYPARAEYLLDG